MNTGSPVDDSEVWAMALSNPLDGGRYCSATPTMIYSASVGYDAMDEIQQFLQGPHDEHDLHSYLEGDNMMEERLALAPEEVQATTQPENDEACAASVVDLLDYIPKSNWRSGKKRVPRKKNAACLQDMPSASEGRRHGLRRNNDHWTPEEVTLLVDGVAKYRVGRWTKLKEKMFSSSVRTAANLKDKWRNLLEAYNGNEKRRFLIPLDKALIERIQMLAAVDPYPKSRRTDE